MEKPPIKHYKLCPECGSSNLARDYERSENACQNCGLVIPAVDISGLEESKPISPLSYNRKILEEMEKEELRHKLKEEWLHRQLYGCQEVRCQRNGCSNSISWVRGRKPKYCIECRPIMAKLRVKDYAKRNLDKVRLRARIGMQKLRSKRKLSIERDLTKRKDLHDLAKFEKHEDVN